MTFDVITVFPEMIEAAAGFGVIGKAIEADRMTVRAHSLLAWAGGSIHTLDDHPYGGGPGMVMRAEPIYAAVEQVAAANPQARKILLTPQGRRLDQTLVRHLARESGLILLCGRYEGVDERVRPLFDEEISIGDYILTGGELAALVLIDAVGRLVPGVVGCRQSTEQESFSEGLLEYPQYTRPEEFRGMRVPSILLSGHHAEIERWRRQQARERTRSRRPDLLEGDADKHRSPDCADEE